jgi:subtilisin-like proprotein convertase family protein
VAIPDGNTAGINVPITISGFNGNLADLNFRIDGSACTAQAGAATVGLDHSWVGDLVLKLTSPQGTTVTLIRNPGTGSFGSDGNNFCNTLLDDEGGGPSIQGITTSGAPYTGTFTPASALAAFRGQNPNGTWTLNVSDWATPDSGSLRAFSLVVSGELSCGDSAAPKTSATRSSLPNAAGWNNNAVAVALSAVDNKAGSGVRDLTYSATGAQVIPATTIGGASASLNISAEGTTNITFYARDNAGNTEAAQTIAVNLDSTAPQIAIAAPSSTSYVLNQSVVANYSCAEAGSGLASCTGSVPSGSNIDTSSPGAKTFTVTATDVAGNTATSSVVYTVVNNSVYTVRLMYDPDKASQAGSTVPIKLQLIDALGRNVSSSGLIVHAIGVVKESGYAPGPVEDAGNANPDDDFRFNNFNGAGGYIFNLKTNGLATGTYRVIFRAGADPFTYGARFQIK